jgi:hypothetical protein
MQAAQLKQAMLAVDTTRDLNLTTAASVTLPHQVADISNACLTPETAVLRTDRHAQLPKQHPTNIFLIHATYVAI